MFGLSLGAFDETGATVFAGVMAMVVGGVQAAIYWNQRNIQKRANDQALFDRRYEIYKAIRRMLEAAINEDTDAATGGAFYDALEVSPFILSKPLLEHVGEIKLAVIEHRKAMGQQFRLLSVKGPLDDRWEVVQDAKSKATAELQTYFQNLEDRFREMSLIS